MERDTELLEAIKATVREAVKTAMREINTPRWISQAEAYRIYGRAIVRRWIASGMLPVYCDGDRRWKRVLVADIERCVERNNRQNKTIKSD